LLNQVGLRCCRGTAAWWTWRGGCLSASTMGNKTSTPTPAAPAPSSPPAEPVKVVKPSQPVTVQTNPLIEERPLDAAIAGRELMELYASYSAHRCVHTVAPSLSPSLLCIYLERAFVFYYLTHMRQTSDEILPAHGLSGSGDRRYRAAHATPASAHRVGDLPQGSMGFSWCRRASAINHHCIDVEKSAAHVRGSGRSRHCT
jgi:hypothetical protein